MTIEEQLNELREQFNHKLDKIVSAIDRQQDALSVVSKYLGKQLFPRDNPVVERQESNVEPKQTSRYIKVGADTIKHVENLWPGDALTAYGGPIPEIKRDWEVLEFRDVPDGAPYPLSENGLYEGSYTLNEMLHCNACVDNGEIIIHSVRRITDGQVFTVGDRITIGTIDSFQVIDSFIRVRSGNSSTPLNAACKKDPIFTTSDGVEIYDPMKIVYYHWKNGKIGMRYAQDLIGSTAYSTWEAAQVAYKKWLQSQRVLTLGDVLECDGDIAKLEEIVKTRL